LSPFYAFGENVGIDKVNVGTANYPVWELEVNGIPLLLIYLVVAAILYFVAYKIYKKRHIEQAGDLLTVSKLKPVFRWGVGTTGGMFIGLFVKAVLEETGLDVNLVATVILILLFGGLCYFFAEMFIRKSFRVFKKKNWMGCGKFTVILFASFFLCFGIVKYEENFVPSLEDIESVMIYNSYEIKFKGEDGAFVTGIHEKILENKGMLDIDRRLPNVSYRNVRITYELKSGRVITRRYLLPMEGEVKEILSDIAKMENSPEAFISSYLKYDEFQAWDSFDGEVTYERLDSTDKVIWENKHLSDSMVRKFYEAAVKDAKAGTLMKYNRNQYYDYYDKYGNYASSEIDEYVPSITSISIYFRDNGREYYHHGSIHINFGPDCENLVQALIDCGFIESVDEILWQ
jgi:ABC-2 type transport system permease protein